MSKEEEKGFIKIIGNEVVTLTSETPYSGYHFETKIQAKFDKYDQSFKQKQQ